MEKLIMERLLLFFFLRDGLGGGLCVCGARRGEVVSVVRVLRWM